jgi:hypothetical protein
MRICISGRGIDDFSRLSSGSVTGLGGWCACRMWSRLWNLLSVPGGWRCTCSFVCAAYLRILCGAIWARKAAECLILMKHCQLSLYRRLPLFVPSILNTPLRFFSDLSAWFLYEIYGSLNCGVQHAFPGHFGDIQRNAYVGLFQLYPTSLPCHICRHVRNQHDFS